MSTEPALSSLGSPGDGPERCEIVVDNVHPEPFFNLKAVVMQTGLRPDTLRAWERRYGLPSPTRSEGGHRLYSRRDIETIKWLVARQDEGLSISRAVELWQQMLAAGQDPLDMPAHETVPQAIAPELSGESLTSLRQSWLGACLRYDERRAEQIVAQAFALYPPETVVLEVLQKAVAQVGEGWYRGEISVQQEHFCSELVVRRLEALLMASPPPSRAGRILAACPPGETHLIGLLLLTFLLRRRGWDVVYLGANLPVERLEATVQSTRPHLVILAAQLLHTAASLRDMAGTLAENGVPLAYGGLVFNAIPSLRASIAGHFLGERLDQAPQAVESLLAAPAQVVSAVPVPPEYESAREELLARQGLVEAELMLWREESGLPARYLALANEEMRRNLDAALALGDLEALGSNLHWVAGLLPGQGLPPGLLAGYLTAYGQALEKHLGSCGAPIVDWFRPHLRPGAIPAS